MKLPLISRYFYFTYEVTDEFILTRGGVSLPASHNRPARRHVTHWLHRLSPGVRTAKKKAGSLIAPCTSTGQKYLLNEWIQVGRISNDPPRLPHTRSATARPVSFLVTRSAGFSPRRSVPSLDGVDHRSPLGTPTSQRSLRIAGVESCRR